jgi:NADH:ubiquinone reductase (non-electrogenic)
MQRPHITEVSLLQGAVKEVRPAELQLRDGSVMDFGLCIWSTGVGPTQFIESLPFSKTKVGRIAVTEQLQVLAEKDQVHATNLFSA